MQASYILRLMAAEIVRISTRISNNTFVTVFAPR